MPRARRFAEADRVGDAGSASIEFLTVGLLLLVPLVYLVIALAAVQGAALGVEGAARQASRVFVQSPDERAAESAAGTAVDVTLRDYGVDAGSARVRITCAPHPDRCLARRGFVTVRIDATVALPLVPPALGAALPLRVPVEATATEQVSRFWGAGMRRLRARDDGSTLPLILVFGLVTLVFVLVVASATDLYLDRKRLFTLADGAALVGAESFRLDAVRRNATGFRPDLTPSQVRSAVAGYLAGVPADGFRQLRLERATTPDGRSAAVTLSAMWEPPVPIPFVPGGIRTTATARSVLR